jgi:hypothetical protein
MNVKQFIEMLKSHYKLTDKMLKYNITVKRTHSTSNIKNEEWPKEITNTKHEIHEIKDSNSKENIYPKFVAFDVKGYGALRLIKTNKTSATYYRDGGHWDIKAKFVDGKLKCVPDYKEVMHLKNKELIPISFDLWKKDNGQYVPKSVSP